MSKLRGWIKRIGRSVRSRRFDAEMEAEMQAHRELEAAALRSRGLDSEKATRVAALNFGTVDALKEEVRDRRLARVLHEFFADARYALRQLRGSPTFTIVAVSTLALGIGASTAMFSALDGMMFRPMPYPNPERLMLLLEVIPHNQINSPSGGAFIDWRTHQTKFEGIALNAEISQNARYSSNLERLHGSEVTHEFFDVLGVKPILGRTFLPTEDQPAGDNRVVVLTEDFWRTRFSASPAVLGSTLVLDEVPHTIIGVVPKDYIVPTTKYFVPAVAVLSPTGKYSRNFHWANVIGRLRSGVSADEAEAELKSIKTRMESEYPVWKKEWSVAVRAPRPLITAKTGPLALTLTGAVSLVLLIACANVANLLLARATHRQQELALRTALGATTSRIVRQVLTESLLLALIGGFAGVLLAAWLVDLFKTATADFLPPALAPALDLRVLTAAVLVSVFTGFLFGLLPALKARRQNVNHALKDGGRSSTAGGRSRSQSLLIVTEVALSVVLVTSAGLLLRSLANTIAADPGFEPQRVLAFDLSLPATSYPTPEARLQFANTLLERLRGIPSVENVGTGMSLPFAGGGYGEKFTPEGQTPSYDNPGGRLDFVSPGYLESLGARLIAGRWIQPSDNRADVPRVGIINATTAKRIFAEAYPVGRKFLVSGTSYEVIGVIADIADKNKDAPPPLFLYAPQAFDPSRFSVVVRTVGRPEQVIGPIREALLQIDAGLPMASVRTLEQAMHSSLQIRRFVLILIAGFAGASLLLACIGLYGVMAFSVNTRSRELSIRLALGAARGDVLRLVIKDGFKLIAWGLVGGGLLAHFAARTLRSELYGVDPQDPAVTVTALVVLSAVSLFACWWPALRATRLSALAVLRTE